MQYVARTSVGILSTLIPRFGIRVLNVSNPVLRSRPALKYFTEVMCAKTLADIRSANASMGMVFPGVLLNRPYLIVLRSLLGLVTGVTHNYSYQTSATTELDMNFIRTVSIKDGKLSYLLFGDEASKPLRFNILLQQNEDTSITPSDKKGNLNSPEKGGEEPVEGNPKEPQSEQATPQP